MRLGLVHINMGPMSRPTLNYHGGEAYLHD